MAAVSTVSLLPKASLVSCVIVVTSAALTSICDSRFAEQNFDLWLTLAAILILLSLIGILSINYGGVENALGLSLLYALAILTRATIVRMIYYARKYGAF